MQRQQLDLPTSYWPEFLKKGHLSNLTHARSWHAAKSEADADYDRFLTQFIGKLQDLKRQLQERERPSAIVSPTELHRDIEALYDEFSEVDYDFKTHQLKVVTDPIVMEGIDLGPFQIVLNWKYLGQRHCYRVIANDPQPAHSNRDQVHPHLNNETLCEGDGALPIRLALEQGRLLDFFMVVRQVLTTFNPDSAYLSLDRWHGSPCQSCSTLVDDEDFYSCCMCHEGACRDCSDACYNCSESCCRSCLMDCPHCDSSYCSNCMSACTVCCENACASCLTHGECPNCDLPPEEEDEEPDEAEQPAESTVHPVCLGEAALLA